MDNILSELYKSLDISVFSKEINGNFKLRSQVPVWLTDIAKNDPLETIYCLGQLFPFLECVLPDFEQHWSSQKTNSIASGIWIETDREGKDIELEASAVWLDGCDIIIIKKLGGRHFDDSKMLQKARDNQLIEEQLRDEVIRRTKDIKEREEEIAMRLSNLTSFRDSQTGEHVRRIGYYAAIIGEALGWSKKKIQDIRIAAPMHDIGKISVKDSILLKAGKLTEEEFKQMQLHTTAGYDMLKESNMAVLDMAADIALSHHEKWDGTGYPHGLSGEDIPEPARITAIVDIYDALVHKRVYKDALSEEDTIEKLHELAGHHIDPHLFKVFLEVLPLIRKVREDYSN